MGCNERICRSSDHVSHSIDSLRKLCLSPLDFVACSLILEAFRMILQRVMLLLRHQSSLLKLCCSVRTCWMVLNGGAEGTAPSAEPMPLTSQLPRLLLDLSLLLVSLSPLCLCLPTIPQMSRFVFLAAL